MKNLINKLLIDENELSNFEEISMLLSISMKDCFFRRQSPSLELNLFETCFMPEKALSLEGPFIEEEVKLSVFSMDKDKSPCPDEFSMFFYQSCWDLIKVDLLKVLKEFHDK